MKVNGKPTRTIWVAADGWAVEIIDQTRLPHAFVTVRLESLEDAETAIRDMWVRGAPLIGATAAYGLSLALRQDAGESRLDEAYRRLLATRPTAINLRWALDDMMAVLKPLPAAERRAAAYARAARICDEDVAINHAIGRHGLTLLRALWERKDRPERLNILTHC
ncbi:MAG: S-methyl-5-thioribose-1-phosphate isomerase, partial [Rhodospirillales bacterium]|nr:S-methyl-5-thioribose-1-phosphate isomerase [Rhodospirillales bacterium]